MLHPIGVFDSGIGGLSVLKEIVSVLPCESYVYLGDTARVPYGGKSQETITRFSVENAEFLCKFDIKILVVACHTASSLAAEALKKRYSLPIIGVIEPAAEKALRLTRKNRIGVIGTRATIKSKAFETALRHGRKDIEVYSAACPLFVSLAEEGWLDGPLVEPIVRHYLEPLLKEGIDTLILGCTHYPMLEQIIQSVVTPDVQLINPAIETGLRVMSVLKNKGLLEKNGHATSRFFVTDEPEHFKRVGQNFLGNAIDHVEKVSDYDTKPQYS